MTTFQTHQSIPHLKTPVSEDRMEVNTDMDHHVEATEDIDIDLDLSGDPRQDEEDEHMGENDDGILDADLVHEQESYTAKDDEMADGYVEGSIAERSSVYDEDLEDADDLEPDLDEESIVDTNIERSSNPLPGLLDHGGQIDASEAKGHEHEDQHSDAGKNPELEYREQLDNFENGLKVTAETSSDELKESLSISHHESGLANQALSQYEEPSDSQRDIPAFGQDETGSVTKGSLHEEYDKDYSNDDGSGPLEAEETFSNIDRELEHVSKSIAEQVETTAPSQGSSGPSSSIDHETQPQDQSNVLHGAPSMEFVHVHPIVIIYQDNEISLFPPVSRDEDEEREEKSSTYFLQDEQLANDSIQTLLGALRSILGESIGEQDELTIDNEELGLHINEFSTDCSATSLSEVLDIYVQLQHSDGLDSPPPLYMYLTTRTRLSNRLEYLLVAIGEGKGLSQIRPSDAVQERQQPEDEGKPGINSQDNPLQAHLLVDPEVSISAPAQEDNEIPQQDKGVVQCDAVPLLVSLEDSIPISPPSIGIQLAHSEDEDNDLIEIGTTSYRNVVDGQRSKSSLTNVTKSSPPHAASTEPDPHELDEHTVDYGEFIDYEDDERPAQGTSSGSSTLQGDAFDAIANENSAISEKGVPSSAVAELQATVTTKRSITDEGEVTHDTLHSRHDGQVREAGEQGQDDGIEDDQDYLEYSEGESKATSTDGDFEEGDNSRDFEQINDQQNDDLPLGTNTGVNCGEKLIQPWNGAIVAQNDPSIKGEKLALNGDDNFEHTLLDDEQQHGLQFKTSRPDYKVTKSNQLDDRSQQDSDDDLENTEFDESKITLAGGKSDVGVESPSTGKMQQPLSANGVGSSQEDDDEITYDDENEGETPEPSNPAERNGLPSPGSLKRARSLDEDGNVIEVNLLDAKRIRST